MTVDRILIIGLGSIGRRHLRNIHMLLPNAELAVWRQYNHYRLTMEDKSLLANVFSSQAEALDWNPAVVVVANPAPFHVRDAVPFAEAGAHLYLEKPLSSSWDGVERLVQTCRRQHVMSIVGYNFRYTTAFQRIKQLLEDGGIGIPYAFHCFVGQYLPDWRSGRDYRLTVSAQSVLGGGALLELSHEVDYVRALQGPPRLIQASVCKLGDLDVDVDDCVDIIIQFQNKTVANIHLDMLRRDPCRICTIMGSEGTVKWDLLSGRLVLYTVDGKRDHELLPGGQDDRNDMYLRTWRCFLAAIEQKTACATDIDDGARTLRLILAARRSSELGERMTL